MKSNDGPGKGSAGGGSARTEDRDKAGSKTRQTDKGEKGDREPRGKMAEDRPGKGSTSAQDGAAKGGKAAEDRSNTGKSAEDGKSRSGRQASDGSKSGPATTGSVSASGGGRVSQLPSEQRTKVVTTFSRHRTEAVTNIDINVAVGVPVPRSVRLVTIPQEILVIVPEYRRYRYFIDDDRVCIVDPDTFVIVDVIILT